VAKAIATEHTVFEAADALMALGSEPSVINVQARVGGSFTTVKRFLGLWQERRVASASMPLVPSELEAQGSEWLRSLWATASALAARDAQNVRDQARDEVGQVRSELSEATAEVQRLESIEGALNEALEKTQASVRVLELRNAALETQAERVTTLERELESLRQEMMGTADVRTMLADLQSQVSKLSTQRSTKPDTKK
jgi:DNA repair exonuclease SbcCD ATPase subunit